MTTNSQSQTTIANLHQQAEATLANKQFQETISLCRQILQDQPNFAPAYQTLGKAWYAVGELEPAADTYKQALNLEPNNAQAWANLGSIYAQQQQWQDALQCYQKATQLKPDLAGAYRNIARVWERLNQPEKALKARERAYSLEPDQVTPQQRLELGDEFSKLGQIEKAIASYQRAVEASPQWAAAYQRLGNALAKAGRDTEAKATLNKAQAYDPQMAESRTQEATPPQQGSHQQAEDATTYKRLAQSHAENQQWQQVIEAANQALSIEDDAETWHLLGKGLQATKNPQKAGQAYRKAIALQPMPESYTNLGSLYANHQQWQQAIGCYQQALKIDSQQPGIWRNFARTLSKVGNANKAAEAWYRAYCLEPTQQSAEEHLQLGDTLAEGNKLNEAIGCYQNAIAQHSNWALAHYRLGETLKQAGRPEEATASLRRAIECHETESTPTATRGEATTQQQTFHEESSSPVESGDERTKWLLQQALETDDGDAYVQLTQAYLEQEQVQRAIAAARQGLAIQPDAHAYRWLGIALQENKQMKEAKDCFQAAISQQPNWADPKVDLGNWHLAQKQWRRAIKYYRQALQLNVDHSNAYRGLAQAFEGLGRQAKALEHRYHAVAQTNDETTAEECVALARNLAQRKQWEKAITCYRKALDLNAEAMEAQQELGDILAHQGQPQEASKCYRQVLHNHPHAIKTWQALGKMLTQLGEQEEAEACYEQAQWLLTTGKESESSATAENQDTTVASALRLQKEAEASWERGDSELALKKYQEAFAHLTGQNTSTEQVDIFLFSSDSVERLSVDNSGKQSLDSLTQLTFFTSTFPTFTKGLSWLLGKAAKLKWLLSGKSTQEVSREQQPSTEEAIEVIPDNATGENSSRANESAEVLVRRASACLEAGDFDRCLLTCEELVQHYPQYSEGYKLLGQAHYRKGELSLALDAYRQAITLNPEEAEARFWSGVILASQEQWQDAIAYYRQALQQEPQNWEVYHYLGEALEATGDLDSAIAAYEKATELAG